VLPQSFVGLTSSINRTVMTTALPIPDIRNLRFRPLESEAVFRDFKCGEREIDRNIEKCCFWHNSHRARVFCAHINGVQEAYGFYCIGVSASETKHFDEHLTDTDDYRPFIPLIYVYYLAVRENFQNQKIGTMLLGNMLSRCGYIVRNVGVYGIALNALTSRVLILYEKYGFRQFSDTKYPLMLLPTQSLIELTERDYGE